jgi:hypothetical protein
MMRENPHNFLGTYVEATTVTAKPLGTLKKLATKATNKTDQG